MRDRAKQPWWWGFGMPPWQRFVIAALCGIVIGVASEAGVPVWLVLPVAFVLIICLPGVAEVVHKGLRR